MNQFLFLISLFSLLLSACGPSSDNKVETKVESGTIYFGDSISEQDAVPSATLISSMGSMDSMDIKLTGKIMEVCQKKGCWMEMEIGEGKTMRVSFKDYAFFVPKDAGGRTAIIEGYAKIDTISVEDLKHYASDAGKSKDEIEKITAPEVEITFEASGVILKEK